MPNRWGKRELKSQLIQIWILIWMEKALANLNHHSGLKLLHQEEVNWEGQQLHLLQLGPTALEEFQNLQVSHLRLPTTFRCPWPPKDSMKHPTSQLVANLLAADLKQLAKLFPRYVHLPYFTFLLLTQVQTTAYRSATRFNQSNQSHSWRNALKAALDPLDPQAARGEKLQVTLSYHNLQWIIYYKL